MSSDRDSRGSIPRYTITALLLMLVYNYAAYSGARFIAEGWEHYCFQLPADELIPLLPWTTVIYFVSFLFWAVNYTLATRYSRASAYHFTAAELLGKLICFGFFITLPTTITRPDISGSGVFDKLLLFLYSVDAPDNLFPSIHCYASWMCFIGVRGNTCIPRGYKYFSCVLAVLIAVSTLTTKQHVIVDAIAGIILAELCWAFTAQFECIGENTL